MVASGWKGLVADRWDMWDCAGCKWVRRPGRTGSVACEPGPNRDWSRGEEPGRSFRPPSRKCARCPTGAAASNASCDD